jgi:hypothetical protein
MARRHSGHGAGSKPRRRWVRGLVVITAVVVAIVSAAPAVLVHTPLRDRPLALAFAGIDGSITSSAASWRWMGGVEYRDVVLRDRSGRAAVFVPRLALDRGLLRLACEPRSLGTMRFVDPEVLVEVRGDGSSLEDIIAPWLAATARPLAIELEVVNGTVELVDTVHRVAWRLSDVIAAGSLQADGSLAGWTAAGRLRHSDGAAAVGNPRAAVPPPGAPVRLDRATIPAAAAAVLVRDGGWSLSSPPAAADGGRTITLATHRLPLGASTVVASRFGLPYLVDGIADLRLDVSLDATGRHLAGEAALERFAVCDAETLAEQLAIARCHVPFDLSLDTERIVVRRLEATSDVLRAQATGSVRMPTAHDPAWAERLIADDFTASIDIELASAATALPGGLRVRPDVRVTGGSLRLAAAARGDGGDRVVELRATVRDLTAVRSPAADAAAGEPAPLPLAWPEPFSAWVRGRRGPGRGERLRIEEAKLVSQAVEATASGSPAAFAVQWQADLAAVVGELAQVLDLGAATAAGTCRGRLDVAAAGSGGGPGSLTLAASLVDVEVNVPGRPTWRDAQLSLEAEAEGSVVSGGAAIDRGRAVIASGDDRLEASLDGGAVVDLAAVVGFPADTSVAWIRPAANSTATKAVWSLVGDLARWQPRLATILPTFATPGLELAGTLKAGAEVAPQGDVWQWTRAGCEIEKLVVRHDGREIVEPRVVITSAGRIDAVSGRVDITSGELLSTSLSLRTGGLAWLPATVAASAIERLRGRMQWQADVGRVEPWLVPAAVAKSWPAAGRGWGTIEIIDTQAGVNLLVEATGSQLTLASGGREGQAARPVWSEPRVAGGLEVTRPRVASGTLADQLRIDRLSVESSTLAVAATGRLDDWSTRRVVMLEGTAAYDWQQVSRLISPWTGGRIRLVGSEGRPFALRVPLAAADSLAEMAASGGGPASATVPLPADWLAATRGTDAEPDLAVRVTRPASTTTRPADDRLKSLAIDTTAAWSGGDVEGFSLAAGEMPVRLLEGQLAFGPFDIPVAGGRVRGAPWVRLVPAPGELVIPPGRLAERVALSEQACRRIALWLSPVLGHAAHAAGVVSVDLAGARLPFADAFGGELAGQLIFENLELSPSPAVQPLVNLLVKLQSVVDPRFAFGDKAVVLRVRPDPVRVRLAGRRIAHDGLVMDSGQLVVKSQGSVGQDGSLDMRLEVALRGDLVGQTPVLGTLFRTPLIVPLKGTVEKPQFDAAALDSILGRIVENTAEAVLKDGIGRGLEAVFGSPEPPPAAPAPARPQP